VGDFKGGEPVKEPTKNRMYKKSLLIGGFEQGRIGPRKGERRGTS